MKVHWFRVITGCIFSAILSLVSSLYGPDSSVCDVKGYRRYATNTTVNPLPVLPKRWSTRVEITHADLGYTVDYHEYFDYNNNMGAVDQWVKGQHTRLIFLYNTNEVLSLEYTGTGVPACYVNSLSQSTHNRIFGLNNYTNGTEHIFSAAQALQFGGTRPEYFLGMLSDQRNIPVYVWEACLYENLTDTTVLIDWQFTDDAKWSYPENMTFPVQGSFQGKTHINSSYTKSFQRTYTFIDFRPLRGDEHPFETPVGAYCENRQTVRPLPKFADRFSCEVEIVSASTKSTQWKKVYFDSAFNLSRIDYFPQQGSDIQTDFYDFNVGIVYTLDHFKGSCTFQQMSGTSRLAVAVDLHRVRMKTPAEYFGYDRTKFQYSGQRTVRGILCDVYVGLVNEVAQGNTVTEVYFEATNESATEGYGHLVLQRQISINPASSFVQNAFNVDHKLVIWKTDLSTCFKAQQRHEFTLIFSGTNRLLVAKSVAVFNMAVYNALVAVDFISPTRIANIETVFVNGSIATSGILLGLTGSERFSHPVSLNSSLTFLSKEVKAGNFFVLVSLPEYNYTLTAVELVEDFVGDLLNTQTSN